MIKELIPYIAKWRRHNYYYYSNTAVCEKGTIIAHCIKKFNGDVLDYYHLKSGSLILSEEVENIRFNSFTDALEILENEIVSYNRKLKIQNILKELE